MAVANEAAELNAAEMKSVFAKKEAVAKFY